MQSEGRTLLITFAHPIAEKQLSEYDLIVRLVNRCIVHEGTRKGMSEVQGAINLAPTSPHAYADQYQHISQPSH
jgi:hypothetical protein